VKIHGAGAGLRLQGPGFLRFRGRRSVCRTRVSVRVKGLEFRV